MEHSEDGDTRGTDAGPSGLLKRAVFGQRWILGGDAEVLEVRAQRQSESGGCGGADRSC